MSKRYVDLFSSVKSCTQVFESKSVKIFQWIYFIKYKYSSLDLFAEHFHYFETCYVIAYMSRIYHMKQPLTLIRIINIICEKLAINQFRLSQIKRPSLNSHLQSRSASRRINTRTLTIQSLKQPVVSIDLFCPQIVRFCTIEYVF